MLESGCPVDVMTFKKGEQLWFWEFLAEIFVLLNIVVWSNYIGTQWVLREMRNKMHLMRIMRQTPTKVSAQASLAWTLSGAYRSTRSYA